MRTPALYSIIATIALASGSAHAGSKVDHDAELAKIVAGRTAGTAVDCLRLIDIRSSRIIERTAIIYEGRDGTLYVNKPNSGAAFLHQGLTLVTDTHSDQLCNIDTVRLVDMPARMPMGSVGLGKFIPYPRPARTVGH